MSNNDRYIANHIDLKEIESQFDHLRALLEKKIKLKGELAYLRLIINPPEIIININDIIEQKKYWSNDNYEPITGYTIEEAQALGKEYFNRIYHKEDKHIFENSIEMYKKYKNPVIYSGIYRFYTKSGKMIWCYSENSVFKHTKNYEPWLILNIGMDITDKVKKGEMYLEQLVQENLELKFKGIKELLSKREREILKRIARGQCSNEIAEELFLSYHTVETHRKRILKKLEMKSTAELIKVACKSGLI